MSNDDAEDRSATQDSGDRAGSDFDTALIPHETDEDPQHMSANRAKAVSGRTEPERTGAGDSRTDPNAQPQP